MELLEDRTSRLTYIAYNLNNWQHIYLHLYSPEKRFGKFPIVA